MAEGSTTEQEGREMRDALTEVMRAGARKLIAQALDAEVAELLATYADQRDIRCPRPGRGRSQWASPGAGDSDRDWAGDGARVQGPESSGGSDRLSLGPGPPVFAQDDEFRGRDSLAVFERHFDGGNADGPGSFGGPRGQWPLGQYGSPVEANLAGGV